MEEKLAAAAAAGNLEINTEREAEQAERRLAAAVARMALLVVQRTAQQKVVAEKIAHVCSKDGTAVAPSLIGRRGLSALSLACGLARQLCASVR